MLWYNVYYTTLYHHHFKHTYRNGGQVSITSNQTYTAHDIHLQATTAAINITVATSQVKHLLIKHIYS